MPRPAVVQVFRKNKKNQPQFPGGVSDQPGQTANQDKKRKNGATGPQYRGYDEKPTPELQQRAQQAPKSYES